jgi:mRNA interferase RelE/StbE
MQILVTPTFLKATKKLHPNQKKSIDKAVHAISANPQLGMAKIGNLEGIAIYKFRMNDQKWLLAYRIISKKSIKLLLVSPHENFYRDLKRN